MTDDNPTDGAERPATAPNGTGGRPRGDAVELAAAALAAGATPKAAALAAGVGRRTVHRWLAKPEFREQVSVLRRAALERAAGKLAASLGRAVETLADLLKPNRHGPVRLRAAEALLDRAIKYAEVVDLAGRVAALEAGQGGGPAINHTPPPAG